MTEPALVKTGVPLLDQALGGGVRPGSTILCLGEPTSGMELLAKQFAVAGGAGETVLMFSPDESETELREIMKRFGDPTGVKIVDIASEYFARVYGSAVKKDPIKVRGILSEGATRARREDPNVPDFLDEIVGATRDTKPRRTVIDTLDFFTELYDDADVARTLRALRIVNRDVGGILLVTKVKGTSPRSLETMLEHIADVVLDMRVEQTRLQFEWHLSIRKVRNEPQLAGDVLYNPTPEGLARDTRRRV